MTPSEPLPPRYCDLVMKGGITSGLVYPQAVIELGDRYRFRNIGGTSAGAIAAALSAAAALGERRRAQGGTAGGFARLQATADTLATRGRIFALFQPVPGLRRAFRLAVALSARPSAAKAVGLVLAASLAVAPWYPLALAALLLALGWVVGGVSGMAAALLPTLVCALALAVGHAVWITADRLRGNMLGICPGTAQPGGDGEPGLSDWMHREIRALAGAGEKDGPPVLSEELWAAPPYPDEAPPARDERVLSLEVITTDVSHAEPRTLPFTRGTLWFREDEMRRLFPGPVVDALIDGDGRTVCDPGGRTFYRMPPAAKLPIVVAARMSLSFPVLICAVPLWEQHFTGRARATEATVAAPAARLAAATEELTSAGAETADASGFEMRVCWFTDGGVSSNFPLHLFDAPMPRWPTFAIDLVQPATGTDPAADPVFLPTGNDRGWRPRYTSLDRRGGLRAMGAFLVGIVATMQNWRDLLQGRAPGYRDRIVQVEIARGEGGMNLDMPEEALKALADKGKAAGRALQGFDFDNHFWVRYRSLQAAAERYGLDLHRAMARPPAGAEAAYARARDGGAHTGPYPFTVGQAKEATRRLDLLLQELEICADWDDSLARGAPNPPPALRIVPTY